MTTFDDVEAIRRLNMEYARRIDTGDLAGFAELFADGVWNDLIGADAVRGWLERWVILYDGSPRTAHMIGNLDIDVDGDQARSSSVISVFQMIPGATEITTITVNDYDDEYERGASGWIWRRRVIRRRLVGDTSHHRSGPHDW